MKERFRLLNLLTQRDLFRYVDDRRLNRVLPLPTCGCGNVFQPDFGAVFAESFVFISHRNIVATKARIGISVQPIPFVRRGEGKHGRHVENFAGVTVAMNGRIGLVDEQRLAALVDENPLDRPFDNGVQATIGTA